MVISCEALSIVLLVCSLELGGAGGKRILSPNKCFFFLTSLPDMNLEEKEGAVSGIVTATTGTDGNSDREHEKEPIREQLTCCCCCLRPPEHFHTALILESWRAANTEGGGHRIGKSVVQEVNISENQ